MRCVENNGPRPYSFRPMRPSILFPLFADIRTLGGVGPKVEKLVQKIAGPRLVDLIFDLPVGLIDRPTLGVDTYDDYQRFAALYRQIRAGRAA